MAPLYQRYIPPTSAVSRATSNDKTKTSSITLVERSEPPASKKRKREDASHIQPTYNTASTTNSPPSVVQVIGGARIGDNGEEELQFGQPTGEFAHIRSTKKRHKLEKEARKARKLAGKDSKAGDSEGINDQGEVDVAPDHTQVAVNGELPSTGSSPIPDVEHTSTQSHDDETQTRSQKTSEKDRAGSKRPKRSKRDEKEAEESTEHLEKHRGILQKFQKSQRTKPVDEAEQSTTERPKDVPKHPLRPLEPFEIDLDDNDQSQSNSQALSARPSWLTEPTVVGKHSTATFSQLGLASTLVKRLADMDLHTALPVQQSVIPLLLPPGSPGSAFAYGTQPLLPDLAVSAPTGSGKTLAYLLPMIESLKQLPAAECRLRGLVIVPTRELVSQVTKVASSLAKGSELRVGSASTASKFADEQQRLVSNEQVFNPEEHKRATQLVHDIDFPPSEASSAFDAWLVRMSQATAEEIHEAREIVRGISAHTIRHVSGVDVLVCTPGRLLDHLKSTAGFSLSNVSWLIVDEADKLLDEQYGDFLDQLQHELARPRNLREQDSREVFLRREGLWNEDRERAVRKVILSATMTHDVSQLAMLRLQRPKLVVVQQEGARTNGLSIGDHASADMNGTDQNGNEQYQIPITLNEYCVPTGEGNEKPLYLLRLLELKILNQKSTPSETSASDSDSDSDSSSDSDSDVSTASSSTLSTSSSGDSDSMSVSSESTAGSYHTDKLDPRPSTKNARQHTTIPTVLVFVASNEAAMRLSHLLKLMRPDLAPNVVTWTKSISKPDLKLQFDSSLPYFVVSTDRAGRGLDTLAGRYISHVIQYDVPRSVVAYVHRAGRTARAGRIGHAWTLFTKTEARWFIKEVTKAPSIHRSTAVERVRINVDDDDLHQRYEKALADMKESVTASSRG